MKKRKKRDIFLNCLPLLLLIFIIASCSAFSKREPFKHTFRQDRQNVEKVEICAYEHEYDDNGGTRESLFVLPESDIDGIWADILSLECRKFFPYDPILSYGRLVITITYKDGETEMIGPHNIGWFSPDGSLDTTLNRFDYTEVYEIMAKYADPEILAEHYEYFPK